MFLYIFLCDIGNVLVTLEKSKYVRVIMGANGVAGDFIFKQKIPHTGDTNSLER